MKNILVRAAASPFEPRGAGYAIKNDAIWGNTGNLLFPHSVCKLLMTEDDTVVATIRTGRGKPYTAGEIAAINEKYDMFVIPLANAFRENFAEFGSLTPMVEALKIPCVVVGAGLQAPVNAKTTDHYPFDGDVKRFVKAVLDKSAMLGLRGEMTADYLARLGFRAEKDFTVIGCPSMYLYGGALPEPGKKPLTEESMVCMNLTSGSPEYFFRFIEKCRRELPNHYLIPQGLHDLNLLYAGVPIPGKVRAALKAYYPFTASHELLVQNRVRMFTDVPSWLAFLGGAQFSFGRNIHGNIAAVLAGAPAFVFAPDARVLELAEYHSIPHMLMQDITPETDIREIYEKTDFHTAHRAHAQRFGHFSAFLRANGIEHVYEEHRRYDGFPFDKKLAEIPFPGPVESLYGRDAIEQAARLEFGYAHAERRVTQAKAKEAALQEEIARLEQEAGTINPVKIAMRWLRNVLKRVRKWRKTK